MRRTAVELDIAHIDRKIEQHHIVKALARELGKLALDLLHVGDAVVEAANGVERGEKRPVGAFAAVVAPHGQEDVFHALLTAGLHSGEHALQRPAVAGNKALPGPCAAGEPGLTLEFGVCVQHFFVPALFVAVVIPVDQLHSVGAGVQNLVGDQREILDHVCAVVGQTEEHIRPHNGGKVIFLGQSDHALQVAVNDVKAVGQAVLPEVCTHAEIEGLVHTNMDVLRGEAGAQAAEHILDQLIGTVLTDKENVGGIANVAICVPAEDRGQVRQRLNAGDQLHADRIAVGDHVLHFCL